MNFSRQPRTEQRSDNLIASALGAGLGLILASKYQRYFGKYNAHTKVDGTKLWSYAEKLGEDLTGQLKPGYSDFTWQFQKVCKSNKTRPDIWGYKIECGSRRGIIGDIKYVDKLTKAHVRQIDDYAKFPFFAKEKFIIARKDTVVPEFVVKAGIEVHAILPTPNELVSSLAKSAIKNSLKAVLL
jgi:hypothetical protein